MSDRTSHEAHPHAGDVGAGRTGGFWHAVREVVLITVTALVISFVVKTFLAQAFFIPSGSMEDTLAVGDRVMVSKIQAGPLAVDRGDIVVFEDPGGWLGPVPPSDRGPVVEGILDVLRFVGVAPTDEGNHLIKRVVGTGGDEVVCCDEQDRLMVNGHPLEEDYLFPGDVPSSTPFAVTVPRDHVWLMGDHRSNSRDSRAHDGGNGQGAVPVDNVVGQAFVLLYPFAHATWFAVPDTYADVPAPEAR